MLNLCGFRFEHRLSSQTIFDLFQTRTCLRKYICKSIHVIYIYIYIYTYTYEHLFAYTPFIPISLDVEFSRLLKIIGLFCKRAL